MAYISQSLLDPGGTGDYISINLFEAGEQEDLAANDVLHRVYVKSSDGSKDSTQVTINGWGTTTATQHIEIWATGSDRHNGIWDTSKWRHECTDAINIDHYQAYTKLIGLQMGVINIGGGSAVCGYARADADFIEVGYCILSLSASVVGGGGEYRGIDAASNGGKYLRAYNNLVFAASGSGRIPQGFRTYVEGNDDFAIFYNNTIDIDKWSENPEFFGDDGGIRVGGKNSNAGKALAKNNVVVRKGTAFTSKAYSLFQNATWHPSSSHNLSTDSTADGVGDVGIWYITSSVLFEATGNNQLSVDDINAKDKGIDLSADTFISFSDDITGYERPYGSVWDLGAFEWYPIPVIRSKLESSIYSSGRENTLKATFFTQNSSGKKVII